MTIKELKQRLNEFDDKDEIVADGKVLRIYHPITDWYSYIRFQDSASTEQLKYEEKLKYLKVSFGIVSEFKNLDFKTLDMIVSLSKIIDNMKGGTDLKSIFQVKKEVEKRAANNSLPEGYQANKQ